jgi:formate/nitrite transporter
MSTSALPDRAPPPFPAGGIDALPPAEVARKAESVGVAKARMPGIDVFVLAILAGAFIALGAIFSTTVVSGAAELPFGVTRLLAGLTFSLGLILVVGAGAELFTGNNLVVMAWASRRVSTGRLLGNWTLVWVGNLVGAVATAAIVYASGQYELGGGAVGETALSIASAKTSLGFVQAVALGVLCNALVCLAVWLSYGARTTTDKVLAVIPPIAAFVAAGFEHSVANMYFLSIGLLVERDQELVAGLDGVDTSSLSWGSALVDNLLPVTIGNVIGGAVLVGAVYWFVYLRSARRGADTSSGDSPMSPSDSATST